MPKTYTTLIFILRLCRLEKGIEHFALCFFCSEWIKSLTDTATNAFLRAAELGEELKEPWIVCSAATYVWNYNNHILSQNRHREIVDPLTVLLEKLKTVGHAG